MSEESLRSALRLSPDHPWPGLESFDEACNAFFFGMQAETAALFRLVRRETLTLFYGRSGLGKDADNREQWRVDQTGLKKVQAGINWAGR